MFVLTAHAITAAIAVFLALAISNARAADGPMAAAQYVVRPGDTLWGIAAARYDGDPRSAVWRIQQRNGLAAPTLVPGMTLYLPP